MRLTNEGVLRARKLGYSTHKSRLRSINEGNLGKYADASTVEQFIAIGRRNGKTAIRQFDVADNTYLLAKSLGQLSGARDVLFE
jgi:hypothetical protein